MNIVLDGADPDVIAFWKCNEMPLLDLVTLADISRGFTLASVEVRFNLDSEFLLRVLECHPRCRNVQFVVITFTDPFLEFVVAETMEQLAQVQLEADKKLVLLLLGLECAIRCEENLCGIAQYPSVITNLNFARNVFAKKVPYPIIFILPEDGITAMIRFARDFWAWMSLYLQFFEPDDSNQ
jgi:hypothetical protein